MGRSAGKPAPEPEKHVTFFRDPSQDLKEEHSYLTRDDPTGFAAPPAFGPFRVLHQIGVGALGPVFRTYEPTRDRLVAVKVFRLDLTPEQATALADELTRATEAGLFHPSIVEPVAAGVEGTVAYRAEEYVAAESLDVAMRHYAPATIDKAMPFITQLAAAIDFARAAGVGHGALHPRDIFVTPEEARATGFGVVDALDRLGLRAPVRRPYSPPERIAGEKWGTEADVFSLAAIAFELLTGRRPSGLGEHMGALTDAALGIHEDEVRIVLARAMHEQPSERYQTAGEFAAALSHAAGAADRVPDLPAHREPVSPVSTIAPAVAETPVQEAAAEAPVQEADPADPMDGLTLDDFAASPGESAREVARKVLAAREVRRRQTRPKPALEETPAERIPPAPPAALFDDTRGERLSASSIDPVASKQEPVDREPEVVQQAAEEPAPQEPTPELQPLAATPPVIAAVHPEPETVEREEDQELTHARIPDIDSRELDAPLFPDHDRVVVSVDEFRPRDTGSSRADRTWPRTPDRAAQDRAAHERVLAPKPSPIDAVDEEVPLVPFDEPQSERSRIVMLPLAVVLILGLLLGYTAGYMVGSRERTEQSTEQSIAQNAPNVTPGSGGGLETPGTTGKTPVKDFTDADASPAGRTTAPGSAAANRAPVSAAPAATRKPGPATAAGAARRTGQIVITSTPSKAGVTLNGKWVGRTPLTLDDLAFRNYAVRVVQDGYDVARETFTLSASAATRKMDVTLRRSAGAAKSPAAAAPVARSKADAPVTGEIFVDSRPQGARVLVDGKDQGVTPLRLSGQAVGSHVVRLELADHQAWTATARVTAGETARVTGSLDRIR
jgi:hypothetical protein